MNNPKISIIGLGYVGLPLASLFATKYNVIGFDINQERVNQLKRGIDVTLEVTESQLKKVARTNIDLNGSGLFFTTSTEDLRGSNFYIVTVPTPVDKNKVPDLTALYKSSETIGKVLSKGGIVIFESTVFPGATEEKCIPIIEKISGLKYNVDFFAGYSPERINPGDKEHTIDKIVKVISGSTIETREKIKSLYASVITAGIHTAPSIKVAEAAKVIENTQRDINIAFINELTKIFNLLDIDIYDVLEAAGTKWNFLPFKPGLVGGHCIGVDPYYLAQKSKELGYHPEIILAGRRINDSMGQYIASEIIKLMIKNDILVNGANILILGITFKENCTDVRNTKVIDLVNELNTYGTHTSVFDPWANYQEVKKEYGIEMIKSPASLSEKKYQVIVLAVAHEEFINLNFNELLYQDGIIYDLKGVLKKRQNNISSNEN
ncbi:nucleotide sugar dehydrogenase [Seonamhaeicola sp. ML3]|uniref:nucleotide sugar dehydrogenase n=1 Tax=Seonamhaeicola sp. ML3 TaxID=2937786 RepID=UPI00273A7034|nr:nucleotide sugar dehydrogenase [Seonamhaeicola sp. ML3]